MHTLDNPIIASGRLWMALWSMQRIEAAWSMIAYFLFLNQQQLDSQLLSILVQ